jgi:hypothetical protein
MLAVRQSILLALLASSVIPNWGVVSGHPAARFAPSLKQPVNPDERATPLGSLLSRDGTLNLGSGFSGSLDPSGWKMETDLEGRPRFVLSGKVHPLIRLQSRTTLIGTISLGCPASPIGYTPWLLAAPTYM